MEVTYSCECFGHNGYNCTIHSGPNDAPCAFVIERDGKEIKVCTYCDIATKGDKYIARLFDGETNPKPFVEYDLLGFLCIASLIDDERWKDWKNRKNAEINK